MKKILLILFTIASSMGVRQLNAYCFYNYSNDPKSGNGPTSIIVEIYESKKASLLGTYTTKAAYKLAPGQKRCWNWKEIDPKNRKKEWYWKAWQAPMYVRLQKVLGEGKLPIGGAVAFWGTQANPKFQVYFDGKPWKK